MKIDTDSWHFRLNMWAWGYAPSNLCSYVDHLIIAIFFIPIILFMKTPNTRNAKLIVPTELIALFDSIFLYQILGWRGLLFGHLLAWGFMVSMLCAIYLADKIADRKFREPTEKREVKKPKGPNILNEWMKAKHQKICPLLEFEKR